LLQQIKVPYFPNAQLFQDLSPLGAKVLKGENDIYIKSRVTGKTVVRIDCLSALESFWGKEIFRSRPLLMKIITGYECTDDQYKKVLMSYYKRFKLFSDYVDSNILFGDKNSHFITNLIYPIREILDMKAETATRELMASGAKILFSGDEYIYASYNEGVTVAERIEGMEVISR